jgi:phage baseplate assembly protein gpV
MKKPISKILAIGVILLCLGAGATICVSARGSWNENFDSYVAGSALEGQGGWHGWDADPSVTGYVSDTQSRSTPNSVEIAWWTTTQWTDEVHEYSDINSGIWTYTLWQYIPSTMVGSTYFILLNTYQNGVHNNPDWSLQLVSSAEVGDIHDYDVPDSSLPIVTNAWSEIKVVIDFSADSQQVYYNGALLLQKGWTDGVQPGGALNLAAVDLYSDQAYSTSVYYDDMSVLPAGEALVCDAGGPYTGSVNQAIQFSGFASGGTEPYSWAWTFGDGGTATTQNPTHAYTTAGTYNVTLTVTDAGALTATDTAVATITAPAPEIVIGNITGGFGIKAVIKNIGDADATGVACKIQLAGGLIILGKSKPSTVDIKMGESTTIKDMVFGFGKTTITVTADTASKTATGKVILFFVLGVA